MNPEARKTLIKELLSLEPRLSARQIASLAYPTTEVFVHNSKRYPKTYQAANNMLRRMVARKELRVWSFTDYDKPDWFLLNSTPKKKGDTYWYETAAADFFVSFLPLIQKLGGGWAYEPKVGTEHADRGAAADAVAYIEIDMHAQYRSEDIKKIYEKIDQYIAHTRSSGQQYTVIFDFVGGQEKAEERAIKTLEYARSCGRAGQFLATTHNLILHDPEGRIFASPRGLYSMEQVLTGDL